MNYWENDIKNNESNDNRNEQAQEYASSKTTDTGYFDQETAKEEGLEKERMWNEYHQEPPKKGPSKMMKFVVGLTIVSMVGGTSLGVSTQWAKSYFKTEAEPLTYSYVEPSKDATQLSMKAGLVSYANIVESVQPSIVSITSQETYRDIFNNQKVANGSGSGVVFNTEKGILIMTNSHVVDGADKLYASFNGVDLYPATVVGGDSDADVAVIKVEASELPKEVLDAIKPAKLGTSSALRAGDLALAIGNPLGYSHSTTAGIISGVDRMLKDMNSLPLIQTDTPINPGNSGGALVNMNGEVIGLNTIKIQSTDVEGIGFAIPIDEVKPIIDEIIEKGYVSKPYIGIQAVNVTERASEIYELPIGVYVSEVIAGSPADMAGMKKEDVIIGIGDDKIVDFDDLISVINQHKPGDKVNIKVVRNGNEKINLTLTIGDKNNR